MAPAFIVPTSVSTFLLVALNTKPIQQHPYFYFDDYLFVEVFFIAFLL